MGLFDRNSAQISNNVITNLLSSVDQYVPMLQSSNQNLRFALKKLNQNLQTEFGRKNIKMYDINNDIDFTQGSYRYLDSFMATNTLIQKLLYIKNYQNTTGNFPVVDIVFAVNNGINDLLVESISIADKILKDIHQIIDIIIRDVKIYYKVGMSILGLFIIFAFYFIYWTYNSELYRIEQLLKIHQKDVAYIQSMLSRFYNTLESEDYNDFNKIPSNIQFIQENRNNFREKSKIARAHKNVNSKEFLRQYWKKTFLLLLIIIIYVCHSSFSFFSTESYIKGLERKINEISKTQELQYEVSITSLTLALIVTYYNNITIRNRSLFEELEADLTYLLDSINIFVETFKKIDNPYDSNVAPFLFEDACKFVSPEVVPQCKTLIIGSESMGLLSLISYEHSLIQSLYQEYQNSDKSFQSAQELSLKTITKLGAAGLTIRDLIFQMIELVKGSYYDLWKHSNKNLIFFMVSNVLVGFICAIGLWILVFKYLIDSFNRFKRMMKIVPVSVIFRNLTLKGYLIRSSKGKLDSIKHII